MDEIEVNGAVAAVKIPIRPRITKFDCYRKFMEAFYLYQKEMGNGFSYRKFSQMAKISSPNYLQLVMRGQRNMSETVGKSVSKVMGLSIPESGYFMALLRRENARDDESLESAQKDLSRSVKRLVSKQLSHRNVYSEWHHLVVREMIFLPDFKPSGEWISEKLRGIISAEQAEQSLVLLKESNLLITDQETGKLKTSEIVLDSGDYVSEDFSTLNAHHEMLAVWEKIIHLLPKEERELGLINIPISSSKIQEFKRRIRVFQEEIIGWLQDEEHPDQIVQLGCYLIPITRKSVV